MNQKAQETYQIISPDQITTDVTYNRPLRDFLKEVLQHPEINRDNFEGRYSQVFLHQRYIFEIKDSDLGKTTDDYIKVGLHASKEQERSQPNIFSLNFHTFRNEREGKRPLNEISMYIGLERKQLAFSPSGLYLNQTNFFVNLEQALTSQEIVTLNLEEDNGILAHPYNSLKIKTSHNYDEESTDNTKMLVGGRIRNIRRKKNIDDNLHSLISTAQDICDFMQEYEANLQQNAQRAANNFLLRKRFNERFNHQ